MNASFIEIMTLRLPNPDEDLKKGTDSLNALYTLHVKAAR